MTPSWAPEAKLLLADLRYRLRTDFDAPQLRQFIILYQASRRNSNIAMILTQYSSQSATMTELRMREMILFALSQIHDWWHLCIAPVYIWTAVFILNKNERNNTHIHWNYKQMLNTLILRGFGLTDLDFLYERYLVKKKFSDPTVPFFFYNPQSMMRSRDWITRSLYQELLTINGPWQAEFRRTD